MFGGKDTVSFKPQRPGQYRTIVPYAFYRRGWKGAEVLGRIFWDDPGTGTSPTSGRQQSSRLRPQRRCGTLHKRARFCWCRETIQLFEDTAYTPRSSRWTLATTTFHRIRARMEVGKGTSMYIHNVKAALLKRRPNSKLNQCLLCNMPPARFLPFSPDVAVTRPRSEIKYWRRRV